MDETRKTRQMVDALIETQERIGDHRERLAEAEAEAAALRRQLGNFIPEGFGRTFKVYRNYGDHLARISRPIGGPVEVTCEYVAYASELDELPRLTAPADVSFELPDAPADEPAEVPPFSVQLSGLDLSGLTPPVEAEGAEL